MKGSLLIISDNQETASLFDIPALRTTVKKGLASGLKAVNGMEVILIDLHDAAGSLKEIKSYNPEAIAVVIAPKEERKKALEEGAFAFVEKPCDAVILKGSVRHALAHMALKLELYRRIEPPLMVAKSPTMLKVMKQVEKASRNDAPVLIAGEGGTGKAIAARVIHALSPRRTGPFAAADAGKELYAIASSAWGGSLYIRKCAPESLSGISEAVSKSGAEVRLICGIESPDAALAVGSSITLPPLRERKEDIAPLSEHFLRLAAERFGKGKKGLSKNAQRSLLAHDWPGNVQELEDTLNRAYVLSDGQQIGTRHLCLHDATPYRSIKEFLEGKLNRYLKDMTKLEGGRLYDTVVSEVEKALIELVMRETKGNQLKAANTLGLNRNTLRAKIKTYKIK